MYRYLFDNYHNEAIADHVKKVYEKNKVLEYKHHLVPQIDPIYRDPNPSGHFSIRSHFLAPKKHFMGKYYNTFWFNMTMIWIMTIIFCITLYYEHLRKLLDLFGKIKFKN